MDYETRNVEARRILVVGGALSEIGELWHRCGTGFHEGWLASAEPAISAIAYVRRKNGALRYYAGVPVDPSTAEPAREAEGFELLDVPAGRYAFVNHKGSTGEVHNLQVALQIAARTPDGELELYHPTDGDPDADVDIGARLGD